MTGPTNFNLQKDTPTRLPYSSDERRADEQRNEGLTTVKATQDCAKFTGASACMLATPLIMFGMGLKLFCEKEGGGDYCRGLSNGFGFLMMMASPSGLFFSALAVPLTVAGAAATAVTGAVGIPAEWAGRKIKLLGGASADEQREHLTRKFVKRMEKALESFNHEERAFFKSHPAVLAAIALTNVAFLSRDLEGRQLRVGDNTLSEAQIAGQDAQRQTYFNTVCEMKEDIRHLHLAPHNADAWKILQEEVNKASQAQVGQPTVYERAYRTSLLHLVEQAYNLGVQVTTDPVFVKLWNEKH